MTTQLRLQQLRAELCPASLEEQIQHVRERRLKPSIGVGRKQLAKMRAAIAGMELEDLLELQGQLANGEGDTNE